MLRGRNGSDCMMSFLQGRNVSINWSFNDCLRSFFPELNGRNDAQSSIRDRLSWWRFLLFFLLEALIKTSASLKNYSIFLILLFFQPSNIGSWFWSSIHHRTFNLCAGLLFQPIYRIIVFFYSSISQFFQFLDLFLNVLFAAKDSQLHTGLWLIKRFALWGDELLTCVQIFWGKAFWESKRMQRLFFFFFGLISVGRSLVCVGWSPSKGDRFRWCFAWSTLVTACKSGLCSRVFVSCVSLAQSLRIVRHLLDHLGILTLPRFLRDVWLSPELVLGCIDCMRKVSNRIRVREMSWGLNLSCLVKEFFVVWSLDHWDYGRCTKKKIFIICMVREGI